MTVIFEFIRSDIAADMIVALLHTLWQGLVIALVLFSVLKGISGNRSELRYRLGIVSMLLIVVCWLGTFSILQYEPPQQSRDSNGAGGAIQTAAVMERAMEPEYAVSKQHHSVAPATRRLENEAKKPPIASPAQMSINYAGWAIVLWLAGVCVMLTRMFRALAGAAKLRRNAVDIEDPAIVELFEQLCRKMQIKRKIRFAASKTLLHPGVIGFWRPVLLVPVSILSEISIDDLRAILAHELAHIRRFDYLVNFCQMVVEAVLFFNPAVWWVSRQIRIEREACCDAAGVAAAGQRIHYARILFEQFAKAATPQPAMTAAITGFSDDNNTASEDRVKRVIDPQHKPHIKIGWVKLACCVGIAGIVLLGLWKTTDMTIAMAAKIMTPAERIEKMAELEKTHGQPEYDPDGHGEVSEEEKATVAGIIKTWDGKKVDKTAHLVIHYDRFQSSGSIGISPTFGPKARNWRWDGDTGKFNNRNSYGVIYICVYASDYAPACVGPFQLKPGEVKDDIEIVLEKGYPASIQIVDADTQQPVPDVKLSGGYLFKPDGYSYRIHLTTDQDGLAVIKNACDNNVTLKARAAGYQDTTFKNQMLLKDLPLILEMKRAEVAEGMVISKTTGQPISGAVIRVQEAMGKNPTSNGRDYGDILATTDDQGRFVLSQLSEGTTYVLSVKADGYAYAFTEEISAGQKDIQVQLQDEIVIPGKVIGPLNKLPVRDGKPYISYTCVFSWNHHSNCEISQQAFVTIEGDEAFFEITDVWGTHVNIGSGHSRKIVKFDEPIPDEIVLDLNDPLTEDGTPYHKRQLVLEFDTPKGFPPPTGNIRLDHMDPDHSSNGYRPKLVDIVDGRAEAEIVAPGKIGYRIADTIGYWFKENYEVKVDDGAEPLVIKVPVVPAGMLFGQVYEEDGTPAANTMVAYNMPEKSPLLDKDTHFLGFDGKNSASDGEIETKYSINPLPLGGVYRVIAHRKNTYAVSDQIKLTEENPIQEVNLTFPKGVTVSGQILLPDGTPASDIEYTLHFDVTGGHSFGTGGQYTNSQGQFGFEQVNPDADGIYRFEIKSRKDYRPVRMKLEKFDRPLEIQLEQGGVATGQIIDKETGWPIPNVEVSAWYSKYEKDNSEHERFSAEAKTDKDGRFRFSNMKPGREYHLNFSECSQDGSGGIIIGGKTIDRVFKVTPYDWSKLKPRKPGSEE